MANCGAPIGISISSPGSTAWK
jgi:methionine synthase II (cobalamin-independent)